MKRSSAPSFLLAVTLRLLVLALPAHVLLAPGAARADFLDNVSEHELPNGLKVILVENHRAPVLTFQIWYRVGSRNEELGRTGLSHLLEHMMFKGTKKMGPELFSKIVQENGGNDNAFTNKDYTAYFENIVSDRAGIVIELESDRLANLALKESDFAPEKKVVMEERRMRTDDEPNSVLFEETQSIALVGHPYSWPVIGWMSNIEGLTLLDLERYHKTFYCPNNAVVVAAGDFRPSEILATIRKYFAPIPRGPEAPTVRGALAPQDGERRVTVEKPAEVAFLLMAYRVPNYQSPDAPALEVLADILSRGESSRLYQTLVHEKKIALDVGVDYDRVSHDPELLTITAQVSPGKLTSEVESAIEEEIRKLKSEDVTEVELAKARNQIEAGFVYAQDSLFYQAMLLAQWEVSGGGWRGLGDYLPGIRKVTASDVRAVCERYLKPGNRTVGVLVPLPVQGRQDEPGEPGPSSMGSGVVR